MTEAKKMKKEGWMLMHKELKIGQLIVENKPIVRAKKIKALSLTAINKIKHLSREV